MKYLLYLASVLLCLSCKKQDTAASPSRANTFYCQIDGKDFTPYLDPPGIMSPRQNALEAGLTGYKGGFTIHARTVFDLIFMYVYETNGPGIYKLGFAPYQVPYSTNPHNYGWYESTPRFIEGVTDPNNIPPPTTYDTDSVNTGTVTLTRFDTLAHVAAGTFEFTAREAATGKLVHITKGKFDVKL